MRFPGGLADTAILSTLLFPIIAAAVGNIDCTRIVVDKTNFNLKELGGPHSVVHGVDEGPSFSNTTYTIDLCRPLGKAKNVNSEDQCPSNTRRKSPCHLTSTGAWSRALLTKAQSAQFNVRSAKMANPMYWERYILLPVNLLRAEVET